MNYKEISKFIAGAAAIEIINHFSLAVSNILPLHFFGIYISRTTNLIILFGWIIVFIFTLYKGWKK